MACRRAHQQPDVKALAMCSPGVELSLCRRQTLSGGKAPLSKTSYSDIRSCGLARLPYMSTAFCAYETKVANIARCTARRALTNTFEVQHVAQGVLRSRDIKIRCLRARQSPQKKQKRLHYLQAQAFAQMTTNHPKDTLHLIIWTAFEHNCAPGPVHACVAPEYTISIWIY